MDQVQRAEDRLNDLQWLVRGEGAARTRTYEIRCPQAPDRTLAALRSVISKRKSFARITSSMGIDSESVAGEVVKLNLQGSFLRPNGRDGSANGAGGRSG